MLITTATAIAVKLTVSTCHEPTPVYRVQASSLPSGVMTVAQQVNFTVYEISSLVPNTAYDLQLVDTECPRVILEHFSVLTDMDRGALSHQQL